MQIQAAVIKEQGVTFTVVIVKKYVLDSNQQSQQAMNDYSSLFPGMPIVLMAQDNRGIPTYKGRQDLSKFLATLHINQIPWGKYSVNAA